MESLSVNFFNWRRLVKNQFTKLISLATLFVAFGVMALTTGCQGPEGPSGKDASSTCKECHVSDTYLYGKIFEYDQSVHATGVVYQRATSADCAGCHSSEGFVARMNGETVVGVPNPTPVNCRTCHHIHETYTIADTSLRGLAAVTLHGAFTDSTKTYVRGKGTVCMNCHQSRPLAFTPDGSNMINVSSSHWGPHHGTQTNTLLGTGYYEVKGTETYANDYHTTHVADACATCHMYDAGHTFAPNVNACNASGCHDNAPLTNFNYNGAQDSVTVWLKQLGAKLVAAGLLKYNADSSATSEVTGTYPADQAGALFNYEGLSDDKSEGVHNFKYVKALLKNSIAVFN